MTMSFLDQAAAAARAVADDHVDDGAATRLRIRESLEHRRTPSRKRLFTLLGAVIGSLVGSTAFALHAGWQPPWSPAPAIVAPPPPPSPVQPFEHVVASAHHAVVRDEVKVAPSVDEPAAGVAATDATPAAPSVATPHRDAPAAPATPHRDAAPVAPPVVTPRRDAAPPHPDPAPGAPRVTAVEPHRDATSVAAPTSPRPDPELEAYRIAHAAHFRGTDARAALAAWDAYLARFPSGRLAPEARYDRALVLVKLGRWVDARSALTPFASAAAGSYRQREAAQILDAIRDR